MRYFRGKKIVIDVIEGEKILKICSDSVKESGSKESRDDKFYIRDLKLAQCAT